MNGDDIKYLKVKFGDLSDKIEKMNTILTETKTENKVLWKEHSERAKELRTWLSSEFVDLKAEDTSQNKIINRLPCEVISEKVKDNERDIIWNKRTYIGGIVVVILANLALKFMG
jgi:hypothetical protein